MSHFVHLPLVLHDLFINVSILDVSLCYNNTTQEMRCHQDVLSLQGLGRMDYTPSFNNINLLRYHLENPIRKLRRSMLGFFVFQ